MTRVITPWSSCVRIPRSDTEEALSLDQQHSNSILAITDGHSPLLWSFLVLVTNVLASRKIQNPRASLLVFMKKNTRTNSSERHDDEDDSVLLVLVLLRVTFIQMLILMMLILEWFINYCISVMLLIVEDDCRYYAYHLFAQEFIIRGMADSTSLVAKRGGVLEWNGSCDNDAQSPTWWLSLLKTKDNRRGRENKRR